MFVIWCTKRHRCPLLLPLGSKIRGGAAGVIYFLASWKIGGTWHLCCVGVCGEGCAAFAPIFGTNGKICRQCKHISRIFVILLIGMPAAPLILDLSYHRHQRSSDLLDFRISVSQLSSFCLPSIRNWCQASSHRLKISAVLVPAKRQS